MNNYIAELVFTGLCPFEWGCHVCDFTDGDFNCVIGKFGDVLIKLNVTNGAVWMNP